MRVLITNSLVLAAISLAPSVSAAPYSTTSSVDSHQSYPNSTMLARASGTSSVPSMLYPYRRTIQLSPHVPHLDIPRDEILHVESLYDSSPFGHFFGPVADLFSTIGMNTVSDNIPPTESQKAVLDQFHDVLKTVVSHIPATPPVSPPIPRSLENIRLVDPPVPFSSLSVLGDPIFRLLELLSSVGIGANPPTAPTVPQKQLIEKLQVVMGTALKEATTTIPKAVDVLPLNHARSVEERSLQDIVSEIDKVPVLASVLAPVTDLISSLGFTNGKTPNDFQEQTLSTLQDMVKEAVQTLKESSDIVHIQHNREESQHWHDHNHDHESHKDDYQSHEEHKHDGEHQKDDNKSRDAQRDDGKPHDGHKEDSKFHGGHKDGHKSLNMHAEDRHAHGPGRDGDHCQEPRDGQQDERNKWNHCGHHHDGKDRNE